MEQKQFTFRKACAADAGAIMEIIDYARRRMLAEGKHQWDESYPVLKNIESDIRNDYAYVLCADGVVVAYGAVIFGEEPAYRHILNGQWLSEQPYVVLHRLAVSEAGRGQGMATRFFREVEQLMKERGIRSFKVDTNYDNFIMLHLLDKLGFTYCGEIAYDRGMRRGYEKVLEAGE